MEERELLSKQQYFAKIERQSTLSARNHKTAVKAFEGFFVECTMLINKQPLKSNQKMKAKTYNNLDIDISNLQI